MKRVVLSVVVLGAAVAWWWGHRDESGPKPLALYGTVDLRQVQLAFNNSERIAEVLVQEGDRVRSGQVVARLDRSRLEPQVAQAEAQVAAQRQVVERERQGNRPEEIAQSRANAAALQSILDRLNAGSRPEEIAQAQANVVAAQATVSNARLRYGRLQKLSAVRLPDQSQVQAVSQEDLDDAKAALDEAEAKLTVNQKALELAIAGPRKEEIAENRSRLNAGQKALALSVAGARKEDIAQAEAQLQANEANLAYLKQQLTDTELRAPADALVRTRLLEPGEMSSPQRPVLSLAVTDPKWVRAYVTAADLGKVRPGAVVSVSVDSFPDRPFKGWIGFISPVAEFTPKTVQIEELRPSLVYEVRVFVKDPEGELRLGMPATVSFSTDQGRSSSHEVTR